MRDNERALQLDPDERASDAPVKQSGVSWPFPVDRRLDQLVSVANEAGAGTYRNELAAALVANASDDPSTLLQAVLSWRTSRIRDVVRGIAAESKVAYLPRYGPGRRRRRDRD
jgi:hypothetical protein